MAGLCCRGDAWPALKAYKSKPLKFSVRKSKPHAILRKSMQRKLIIINKAVYLRMFVFKADLITQEEGRESACFMDIVSDDFSAPFQSMF